MTDILMTKSPKDAYTFWTKVLIGTILVAAFVIPAIVFVNTTQDEPSVGGTPVVSAEPKGCMAPGEQGTVQSLTTNRISVEIKDDPDVIRMDSFITFKLDSGRTIVCRFEFDDLTGTVKKGDVMRVLGGKRAL